MNQSVMPPKGLRHIVMWTLKDEAEGQSKAENMHKARKWLLSFSNLVPGIELFEVGVKTEGLDCTADLILNSVFKDEATLAAYRSAPSRCHTMHANRCSCAAAMATDIWGW